MKRYNIAISASKLYAQYALVMFVSFLKNHPDAEVHFYVFYIDHRVISEEHKYNKIIKKYNKFSFVHFVHVDYEKIKIVDNKKGWAIDLWCRWYLLDYLDEGIDRILILGIDTFFLGNIELFYFQNMNKSYFSAAGDMYVNTKNHVEIEKVIKREGLNDRTLYVNTDVLLLNLRELRKNLNLSKFLNLYHEKQFVAWDQDVINYCFGDKISRVDFYLYNYFPNLGLKSIDDDKFIKNVKIIHFAGGPKPWNVPRHEISKYSVIPTWWDTAKEIGISRSFTREIKDVIKKLIHLVKKK